MQSDDLNYLKEHLTVIPNFPKEGIQFQDVSSLFEDPVALKILKNQLLWQFIDVDVNKVVGIDARGFVMGSVLAERLKAGFVMARKPGKLPGNTISTTYEKEYGLDRIEIKFNSIQKDDVVIIHDDLLATGGTAKAVYDLVKRFEPSKVYFSCIIELDGLGGRELLEKEGIKVKSLLNINVKHCS